MKNLDQGTRVQTLSKFAVLDGSWGYKDFRAMGHNIINITLAQLSMEHRELKNVSLEIPDNISNHKKTDSDGNPIPERVTLRKKLVAAVVSKTFNYSWRPSDFNNLYPYIMNITKRARSTRFNVLRFTTKNMDTGDLCLWSVIEKDKGVKVPVLAKINGKDATEYGMRKSSEVAGDMGITECSLVWRKTNTLVCQGSKRLHCKHIRN